MMSEAMVAIIPISEKSQPAYDEGFKAGQSHGRWEEMVVDANRMRKIMRNSISEDRPYHAWRMLPNGLDVKATLKLIKPVPRQADETSEPFYRECLDVLDDRLKYVKQFLDACEAKYRAHLGETGDYDEQLLLRGWWAGQRRGRWQEAVFEARRMLRILRHPIASERPFHAWRILPYGLSLEDSLPLIAEASPAKEQANPLFRPFYANAIGILEARLRHAEINLAAVEAENARAH